MQDAICCFQHHPLLLIVPLVSQLNAQQRKKASIWALGHVFLSGRPWSPITVSWKVLLESKCACFSIMLGKRACSSTALRYQGNRRKYEMSRCSASELPVSERNSNAHTFRSWVGEMCCASVLDAHSRDGGREHIFNLNHLLKASLGSRQSCQLRASTAFVETNLFSVFFLPNLPLGVGITITEIPPCRYLTGAVLLVLYNSCDWCWNFFLKFNQSSGFLWQSDAWRLYK